MVSRISTSTLQQMLAELRTLCASLPGAEEYVMVHHPAFRVGKKPFLIVGMKERDLGPTLSINLGRDEQAMLLSDERFVRTRYIGQHGWVTICYEKLDFAEATTLIIDSWRRIAGKRYLAAFESNRIVQ